MIGVTKSLKSPNSKSLKWKRIYPHRVRFGSILTK